MTPATEFLFDEIAEWRVVPGTNGAEQMALDEVMLRLADRPTLRIYRWTRAEVTFGYPQRWEDAHAFAGDRPITRRCTGGGFVAHGDDVTIALAVPADHPFTQLTPTETYRRIHAAIAGALPGTRLTQDNDIATGDACFLNPAPFDVMAGPRKVLGGAQRRSREGLLYQGSLQGFDLETDLSAAFGRETIKWKPDGWQALREELVRERYATESWNRRR